MTEILGLIPARGGSKGVPRKNIRPLVGKPLIAWTIAAAQQSQSITRLIVSTDDDEIAAVARQFGAEVPFMRPAEFAQDTSPDIDVYRHTVQWLQTNENYQPELIVWLRPTTPLRTSMDIDIAVKLLQDENASCLRSVCLVEHHPYWMNTRDGNRLEDFLPGKNAVTYPRRQMMPPVYRLNGAVDITHPAHVMAEGAIYNSNMAGYVMEQERSIDIDSEIDFLIVEQLLKE